MNIIEFSIACKLISAKLKGVQEVPKVIPPTLLSSLQHIGTPIRTPTGAMSPTESYKQFLTQQPVAPIPMQIQPVPQAIIQPQAQVQPPTTATMIMQNQPMMTAPPVQPIIPPQPMMMAQPPQQQMNVIPQQVMPAQQMIPQQMVQPQQIQAIPPQEMIYQQQPQVIPQVQPQVYATSQPIVPPPVQAQPVKVPLLEQLSSGSLLENLTQVQPIVAPSSTLPAAPTPTPPQSGQASRSMSFSEKAPSIPESP